MENILKSGTWIDNIDELNKVRSMYNDWVSKYWRDNSVVKKFEDMISKTHIHDSLHNYIQWTWANVNKMKDLNNNDFFLFMAHGDPTQRMILKWAMLPNKYTPWSTPAWSSTPWNWTQVITINTNTPWTTANINLVLKDWKIQWIPDKDWKTQQVPNIENFFKQRKWVYKEDEFRKLLKDKWIIDSEIDEIVKKLWKNFFKS
jgi:hypothetical protein